MGEFQGESHWQPKRAQRLASHWPKHSLIIPKILGYIFCGLMKVKKKFDLLEDVLAT